VACEVGGGAGEEAAGGERAEAGGVAGVGVGVGEHCSHVDGGGLAAMLRIEKENA
jgi:hypothetical protein